MALGADRAILVETPPTTAEYGEGELEPLAVAKVLREIVRQEGSNMVLMGKQSIDGDHGQTGQMLAGLLGWGQATQACAIEVAKEEEGGERRGWLVRREVDGGVETLGLRLPAVITADLRLNEPRYASLGNIMKAKRKVIEKKTLADYGVDGTRRLRTIKVEGEWLSFFCFDSFFYAVALNLRSHARFSYLLIYQFPVRRKKRKEKEKNSLERERKREKEKKNRNSVICEEYISSKKAMLTYLCLHRTATATRRRQSARCRWHDLKAKRARSNIGSADPNAYYRGQSSAQLFVHIYPF